MSSSTPGRNQSAEETAVRVVALLALISVFAGLIYVGYRLVRSTPAFVEQTLAGRKEESVDLGSIITRVQTLNRLETASMRVMNVGSVRQSYGVIPQGLTGDTITFLAVGDVIAGVDLSKLKANDIRRESDGVVVLRLPPSEILVSRIDNQASHVISRDTGFLRREDPQLESRARMYAEAGVRREALQKGILDLAALNAETRLAEFLHATGVNRVRFERVGRLGG